jgi:hypothetical protein
MLQWQVSCIYSARTPPGQARRRRKEWTMTDLLFIGIMAGAFLACALFIPLLKRK